MKLLTSRPTPTPPTTRPTTRLFPLLLLVTVGPVAVLLAADAAGWSVARAQGTSLSADQKQEMKQHYEKAQRAFDVAKYADAIDEYAKVYEIGGNPSMLFNIAQAHRLNNQTAEALRFYRRYLQRAPNAPNRADVEQKIAELEKTEKGADDRSRAAGAVAVSPAPAPAQPPPAPAAVVTAPPAAPPPPPAVPPPPPYSSPTPPSSFSSTSTSSSTSPSTEPAGQPPVPPSSPATSASGGSSAVNARLWGVVSLLAVGAGGLVLASFEGLNASSKADTIAAQSKQGKVFDPTIETSGRRANAIAITSAIVGSAALVAGGILFLTAPHAATTPESTATGVSLAPLLTPTALGAGASWTY